MNDNEIKKANRKALPKFIFMIVVCAALGLTIGFFSVKYGLNEMFNYMKSAVVFFGTHIAPWLMLSIAVIVMVVFIVLYKKVKNLLSDWNGEDEQILYALDEKLSVIMWLSNASLIVSYFLLTASYPGGFAALENRENMLSCVVGAAVFFVILFETIIIQQKCIDAAKKINPEKTTASVYDMKFQKKWMDNCDEAEKIVIGKCAFKAYSTTNNVCAVLACILTICAFIFNIGILPSLVVCLIWVINQSVYCRETIKYSKGSKIS